MGDTEDTREDSTDSQRLDPEERLPQVAISQRHIPFLPPHEFPTHFATYPLRRPCSVIPEGFAALHVDQTSALNLELLELAMAALVPIEAPADDANAAAAASPTSQVDQQAHMPLDPLIEDSEMLDLAVAAIKERDSQPGTNAVEAAVGEFHAHCLSCHQFQSVMN
jgi:hypothetical protein